MCILYGVENKTIFRLGGEGNQRPGVGWKEIKSRSTVYTPAPMPHCFIVSLRLISYKGYSKNHTDSD